MTPSEVSLLEAFCDAYAAIEQYDARIFHVHVSPDVFTELKKHERLAVEVFDTGAAAAKLWGAEVVSDPDLQGDKVMFRYKRRKAGVKRGRPLTEAEWCDRSLFGRYRKKLLLDRTSRFEKNRDLKAG